MPASILLVLVWSDLCLDSCAIIGGCYEACSTLVSSFLASVPELSATDITHSIVMDCPLGHGGLSYCLQRSPIYGAHHVGRRGWRKHVDLIMMLHLATVDGQSGSRGDF